MYSSGEPERDGEYNSDRRVSLPDSAAEGSKARRSCKLSEGWPVSGAVSGTSGVIHRVGAIAFILLPALYMLRMPRKALDLVRESFTYDREDLAWFKHMPGYFLGSTRNLPPQGRLNAGQKLHHAATFLMFNTVTLSGLIMWFAKGQLGPDGLSWVVIVHDISMLGLSVMMIGHVYFTFLYGALSGMVTGKVTEEYARMEHSKWFESLQPETPVAAEKTEARPEA